MTQFILVRHGETNWSREKKYQGHSDILLSLEGRRNVQALTFHLKTLDLDVLYSSSLKRACQSSDIISAQIGLRARIDSRLNELNFGAWEGKTAEQLISEKDKSFTSWIKGRWHTPPGGESVQSLQRRIKQFLKHCLKRHKNQKIAVVSHGGPIRMMILELLQLPLKYLFSFRVDPASFSALTFSSIKSAQILCLNTRSKKAVSRRIR